MLIGENEQYLRVAFDNEAEIEKIVQENYELLFGSTALYIPQTRIQTTGGKGTIPDAVVIDLEHARWFMVEVELSHHGTWDHIAPQVSKQLAAVNNEATRERILKQALDIVSTSDEIKEALVELGIGEIDIHGRISDILKDLPIVAIPIDEVAIDLEGWARTLKHNVRIWKIEKYVEYDSGNILYSIPDENPPTIDTSEEIESIPETQFQGGKLLKLVLDAGLLEPGQRLWMDYGPRGKEKTKFEAIVREDGFEVGGRVYSPSYAAVACIQKAGSQRKHANGWRHWRTESGTVISELYQKALDSIE